jgi:hypothetical protein
MKAGTVRDYVRQKMRTIDRLDSASLLSRLEKGLLQTWNMESDI